MRAKLTNITIMYFKFKMELKNSQKPNHRIDQLKIPLQHTILSGVIWKKWGEGLPHTSIQFYTGITFKHVLLF